MQQLLSFVDSFIIPFALIWSTILSCAGKTHRVTERALPATTVIHNALKNDLGVRNKIGATIGNVYCGVVGGIKRHEYAVLGPSVNLAARLMTSHQNPGILVDGAVRAMAEKLYGFDALAPVEAKGYSEPVQIFQPLSSLKRRSGSERPNFVGRINETMQLLAMAMDVLKSRACPGKMVHVVAESGMGKSATLEHAAVRIQREMRASRKRIVVAKHACNNGDRLVPFR